MAAVLPADGLTGSQIQMRFAEAMNDYVLPSRQPCEAKSGEPLQTQLPPVPSDPNWEARTIDSLNLMQFGLKRGICISGRSSAPLRVLGRLRASQAHMGKH